MALAQHLRILGEAGHGGTHRTGGETGRGGARLAPAVQPDVGEAATADGGGIEESGGTFGVEVAFDTQVGPRASGLLAKLSGAPALTGTGLSPVGEMEPDTSDVHFPEPKAVASTRRTMSRL